MRSITVLLSLIVATNFTFLITRASESFRSSSNPGTISGLQFNTPSVPQWSISRLLTLAPCTSSAPFIRKEIRTMSQVDWTAFHTALLALATNPSPDGTEGASEMDWWTKVHLDNVPDAHFTPMFLPWHRVYLRLLEQRLQSIVPGVVIPYWDWSKDWKTPQQSPILAKRNTFGILFDIRRTKPESPTHCTRGNRLVHWPNPHCLARRNTDPDSRKLLRRFYAPETLLSTIAESNTYDKFRRAIEFAPHAIVHSAIGGARSTGQAGDMTHMYSPNDPVFFLHHAFIDLLWLRWQNEHSDLQGSDRFGGTNGAGEEITERNRLAGFQGRPRVRDVLDNFNLCYAYQEMSQETGQHVKGTLAEEKKPELNMASTGVGTNASSPTQQSTLTQVPVTQKPLPSPPPRQQPRFQSPARQQSRPIFQVNDSSATPTVPKSGPFSVNPQTNIGHHPFNTNIPLDWWWASAFNPQVPHQFSPFATNQVGFGQQPIWWNNSFSPFNHFISETIDSSTESISSSPSSPSQSVQVNFLIDLKRPADPSFIPASVPSSWTMHHIEHYLSDALVQRIIRSQLIAMNNAGAPNRRSMQRRGMVNEAQLKAATQMLSSFLLQEAMTEEREMRQRQARLLGLDPSAADLVDDHMDDGVDVWLEGDEVEPKTLAQQGSQTPPLITSDNSGDIEEQDLESDSHAHRSINLYRLKLFTVPIVVAMSCLSLLL